MEIIPLGVGSAFARTLENTNFLIKTGDGVPFLLDCGHTATRSMERLGFDMKGIDNILLSHLHADHISGLEEMGFTGLFIWGRKINLHAPKPLLEFLWPKSLDGGMGQRLKSRSGGFYEARLETYFTVNALGARKKFSIGCVEITPFSTPHIPGRPSFGYAMHDTLTGGRAMFTCDSMLSMKNLRNHGQSADVIFHDCQLDGSAEGIHTVLGDLLTVPDDYKKKILLVHYGDEWVDYRDRTGGMVFAEQHKSYVF